MSTHQNPDEIRHDIERTRSELSSDVNALADEARPGNVARRQVEGVKDSARNLKERVFGSPDDEHGAGSPGPTVGDRAHQVGERVQEMGADARDAVQESPAMVKQRTRGNPLAAGLVAFGVGALIGGLLPSSRREQQVATGLKERARPAVDATKDAAKEAAEHLKPQAQEAAQHVKDSATSSAQTVADEGRSQAQDVRDHAQESAQDVRGHAQESAEDVRTHAQGSAQDVRGHAQSSAQDVRSQVQDDGGR